MNASNADLPAGATHADDAVAAVDDDGFVFLPNFCGRELVDHLLRVSLERIRDVRAALGTREIGIGSAQGYDEIVQRSPGRWDLPVSPQQFGVDLDSLPWSGLIATILGPDAEPSFSGVVFSEPHTPAQYWHTDSPHESAEHLPPHAVNVLVALHDVPMEMGPTEFARGTQRLTNHLSNATLDVKRLVYQHETTSPSWLVAGTGLPDPETWAAPIPVGSAIVFDDRLMHRGLANRSEDNRYVAYFSYRKKGYVGTTHFEASRSVYDELP